MSGESDSHFDHFVRARLMAGESTVMFLAGWSGDKEAERGCFILTSQRACFCRLAEPQDVFEALHHRAILRAEMHSTPVRRQLVLRAKDGDLVFGTDQPEADFERLYHRLESLLGVDAGVRETVERIGFNAESGWKAEPAPAAPQPKRRPKPAAPRADLLAVIGKLAQLRDAGVVTDEEFETKAAELLARL